MGSGLSMRVGGQGRRWGEVGPSKNQTEGMEEQASDVQAPDSPSVLSAHTSITVLKSEMSVPMTPGDGKR